MRTVRFTLLLSAGVAVAGLLVLNWRAQLRTQEKLDALAAALADRSAVSVLPQPATVGTSEPGRTPREPSCITVPPYLIGAPDVLLVEAVLKDPKTGQTDRLPTQPVSGQFLVRPDGTVGLGVWGSVSVAGLTIDQAVDAVRQQLRASRVAELPADSLMVVVDVLAYNSKRFYVIYEGAGDGEQVVSLPLSGSETVLDAIANIGGLPEIAGQRSIRLLRNSGNGKPDQVLPVDWVGITQHGVSRTNYQILPGDRLYVTRTEKGPTVIPPELQ